MSVCYEVTVRFQTALFSTTKTFLVDSLSEVGMLKTRAKAGDYTVESVRLFHLVTGYDAVAEIEKERRAHQKIAEGSAA